MMKQLQDPSSICGRCGHPKSTFQTIKFADIFTSLHEGQGECQCGDLPPPPPIQQNHHFQNGMEHVSPSSSSNSSGVPVIQHHTHTHNQYLTHGSHHHQHHQNQQNQQSHHQEQQLQHLHHNNAFIPVFQHEMDQGHLQQQHLYVANDFDTHNPHHQQVPNYAPPTTTTAYLTVVAGHPNGGTPTETKVPISVLVQQSHLGVITKNQNKEPGTEVTPKPPRLPCTLCKKTFVNEKMIKAHMERVHEKKSRFVCEICGAAFSYRGSLDSHLCSHTTNPTITYDCPTCGQKFKQKSNLAQHVKHHSEENPKKFLCPHCPSGFSKRANLRYHIRRMHPGAEEGEAAVIIPPRIIQPVDPLSTSGSSSSSKKRRRKDKSQSQGNGQFKCEESECGRTFLFKNNLKTHLRTHSKEKKYSCLECDKSFMYKESLKNHMLLHSNELPYSCEVCGKQFRDRSNRRKHVKNVHKYLFLNNNNAGENGVGSSESLNGGGSGAVASARATTTVSNNISLPKKKKSNKKTNQAAPPPAVVSTTNVIKKTRKRVKKVVPPVSGSGVIIPTTSTTTSVIVSNSLAAAGVGSGSGPVAEIDRKIIMSPGPRVPDFKPGANVIMKTPTANSQMQNVIVYPNTNPTNNKSVISNGSNFQHFVLPDLQSSQQHQEVSMQEIKQELTSDSMSTSSTGGRGGFQHFTLSRGIITASSAVTNNVHYNYEPQQAQSQQYWNDQNQNSTQTQAISHHEPYLEEEIQSSHQYASPSSNIVYSSSSAAIPHGSNSSNHNMQNNSLQQNNNSAGNGIDPNVEHLDLISQNGGGSAFFYKDLSQFDFSYL